MSVSESRTTNSIMCEERRHYEQKHQHGLSMQPEHAFSARRFATHSISPNRSSAVSNTINNTSFATRCARCSMKQVWDTQLIILDKETSMIAFGDDSIMRLKSDSLPVRTPPGAFAPTRASAPPEQEHVFAKVQMGDASPVPNLASPLPFRTNQQGQSDEEVRPSESRSDELRSGVDRFNRDVSAANY